MRYIINETNFEGLSHKEEWNVFLRKLSVLLTEISKKCLEIVGDLHIEGYSENSSDPLGLLRKEHENENMSHIKVCSWHSTKEICKLASDLVNKFIEGLNYLGKIFFLKKNLIFINFYRGSFASSL
jgi:hypothetical protein